MLVVSYNPGYQNVLKQLKPSTRQYFVAIEFDFPPAEVECKWWPRIRPDAERVGQLVRLAGRLRHEGPRPGRRGVDPPAGHCATLIQAGMCRGPGGAGGDDRAADDDQDVKKGLDEVVLAVFG